MTEKEKLRTFLADLAAFIDYQLERDKENEVIHHLLHDLGGWVNKTKGFSPRTSGYHEQMQHTV
jgi:hypothetical protein